uniref:FF domain-containing protein n=1 Tax=Globodera rostochiensis TaxID=31243 RepID=A0A914HUA2_GLORO
MEATLKTLIVKKSEEPSVPKESAKVEEEDASEYNLKKKQVEKFRELLQDKCNEKRINTNMNWEQASKYTQHDPRYKILCKVSEKKQVFNAWKIQRYKEERDERRFAIKMAKESLEKWLMAHPKIKPTLRYHKAEGVFSTESKWKAVTEPERREIFEDVKIALAKRDADEKKSLKERNIKSLSDILDGIDKIDYRTTWAEAQRILIENPCFAKDTILQGMDKEDALVVFQKHIKLSEEQYVKEKQLDAKRIKRQERKTRESFMQLLHELHDRALVTPTSTWTQLYPMICADQRFENMLLTNGSTALDLFKFYVEYLRTKVSFDESTTFEAFRQWVREGPNFNQMDPVNVKLCFNDFYDRILLKKKEAEKEELKKQKRAELSVWELLRSLSPAVGPSSDWEQVKEKLKETGQFMAAEDGGLKRQFFDSYVKSLQDICGHYHSANTSSKKKKKEKRKKYDQDPSDSEEPSAKSKKKRKREEKSDEEEEVGKRRRKKKRSKKSGQQKLKLFSTSCLISLFGSYDVGRTFGCFEKYFCFVVKLEIEIRAFRLQQFETAGKLYGSRSWKVLSEVVSVNESVLQILRACWLTRRHF